VIENAGHSSVHHAVGPGGEQWVVKRAKRISREGGHQFRNEVGFLSHISHDNIVPFVGWCASNNEQILVFECVANGSLASWLRPEDGTPLFAPGPTQWLGALHCAGAPYAHLCADPQQCWPACRPLHSPPAHAPPASHAPPAPGSRLQSLASL